MKFDALIVDWRNLHIPQVFRKKQKKQELFASVFNVCIIDMK